MSKIPPEILTQHIAVLGKTGSGKTSTAKLVIEQAVTDGARVCVLDPIKSDWWGLTSSRDGKRGGLPFHILGGPHGHVPLHSSAGKAIAEVVANGDLPLSIIDMADFEPGGLARFFTEFAPVLLKKMRGVVYLVLEEAHLFAPKERGGVGDENMAVYYAKLLATAGRSKGIRLILVTQRVQALHNALLGSADTMIAHRMTAPADQEPVVKWLKANTTPDVMKRVAGELASLKTGDGWVCSGEARIFSRVHFDRIATYDNTATPTGDVVARNVKTAAIDQEKLRAIIGHAVEEAKANDPKELKRRVGELERELAATKRAQPAPAAAPERVEVSVLDDIDRKRLDDLRSKLAASVDEVAERVRLKLDAALEPFRRQVGTLDGKLAPILEKVGKASSAPPAVRRPTPAMDAGARANGHGSAPKGERAILTAIAQQPRIERPELTLLTGYKRSTRDAYLQRLSSRGLIAAAGNGFEVTEAGLAELGDDYTPLPTGDALLAHWLSVLPEGERRCLAATAEAGPEGEVDRDAITDATGYKRSTRDAYLQRLAARNLVVPVGRGAVRASAALFG